MVNLKRNISSLLNDESGQDLIEYALVAALIALGATAAMTKFAVAISNVFVRIANELTKSV